MSNFINEIINDINENPNSFMTFGGNNVYKEGLLVYNYGNSRLFSLIVVYINGKKMPTTYIDRWKLEVAIGKWYKTVSLSTLQ